MESLDELLCIPCPWCQCDMEDPWECLPSGSLQDLTCEACSKPFSLYIQYCEACGTETTITFKTHPPVSAKHRFFCHRCARSFPTTDLEFDLHTHIH